MPVSGIVDLINRADVGMVERRGSPRLLEESLASAILRQASEELDRDAAPKLRIIREIDDAHPAFAELSSDPIAPDPLRHDVLVQHLCCHLARCS